MTGIGQSIDTFKAMVLRYPKRTLFVACCLFLAGLSEGLGIGALLPLLKLILGGEGSLGDNWLARTMGGFLSSIGVEPSAGTLLAFIASLIMIKGALLLLSIRQVGFTAARVETDLRLDLLRSLVRARWPYYLDQASGRLANAMTTEAVLASYCYEVACKMIAEFAQLVVYVIVAILISWPMTLGGLIAGGLSMVAVSKFMAMARTAGERQTNLLNQVAARLVDSLGGIKPLKAMACEERVGPLLEYEIQGLRDARQKQVISIGAVRALIEPLFTVLLAAGAYMAFSVGHIQLEVLMVLIVLFWRGLLRMGAFQAHYQEMARYESAFWSLQRAIEDARAAEEESEGRETPILTRSVALRKVTFSFGDKIILKDASLTVDSGTVTALVGPSGSGKTTVADLIAGLLTPQSGEVWIDDTALADVNLREWRRSIGYVPQDTTLFHDTLLANITLEDPAVTRKHAEDACRQSGVWEYIASLPQGLDTIVGERGGKLSGGQRQRVALARALVRKPSMLILDEVTSGLDPETEKEIVRTILQLKGKTTILIISHQDALVQAADFIHRLENQNIYPEAVTTPDSLRGAKG